MYLAHSVRFRAGASAAMLCVCLIPSVGRAMTVATFSDPTEGDPPPVQPLFTVDFVEGTMDGSWPEALDGLNLEVPWISQNYNDAYFTMTQLTVAGDKDYATTGSGVMQFFDSTDLLVLTISFSSATSTSDVLLGINSIIVNDGVQITGVGFGPLTDSASFSFSLTNVTPLPGNNTVDEGFTATAAFTSSALPEPASVAGLMAGLLPVVVRRRGRRNG